MSDKVFSVNELRELISSLLPRYSFRAVRLFDVADVWGIGRRHLDRLHRSGVHTAYDLTQWSEDRVRHVLSLPGVYTWRELRGQACLPLEPRQPRQSVTSSRSFREPIYDLETLRPLVADFAAQCCRTLRAEGTAAEQVSVYVRTDRFRPDLPQYANSAALRLDVATSDVRELVAAAERCLEAVFRPGYGYKQRRLLEAIDRIQQANGRHALRVALQGDVEQSVRRDHRSPCYTTRLSDIITVRAD